MYKLPTFFSKEITRQGKLTATDIKKLKMDPEDIRKMESRWSASKNAVKETTTKK